jgi:RNA polymerase sigma factor (TIGR02999 family)
LVERKRVPSRIRLCDILGAATGPGMRKADSEATVTGWLKAWGGGDEQAGGRLYELVYQNLHRQAARLLRRERRDHTLQPTALVHEAYLRLADARGADWPSRAHFYAMAARVMRHVLVDHARRRRALKRDGAMTRVAWDDAPGVTTEPNLDVIALEEALQELARLDPEQTHIVELRLFAGLSVEETAEVTGVSTATVKREWRTARAWLRRKLGRPPG